MMDKEQQKQLIDPAGQLHVSKDEIANEASQQANQLRVDSSNMLKQLMLEQKAKLQEMVQQLQNQSNNMNSATAADKQILSTKDSNAVHHTNKDVESKIPLDEVTRLQQSNMVHIDILLKNIHATMKSNMNEPDAD